jgi:hypothetical protein
MVITATTMLCDGLVAHDVEAVLFRCVQECFQENTWNAWRAVHRVMCTSAVINLYFMFLGSGSKGERYKAV